MNHGYNLPYDSSSYITQLSSASLHCLEFFFNICWHRSRLTQWLTHESVIL